MKKKILAIMLCLTVCTGMLTGCGNGEGKMEQTGDSVGSVNEAGDGSFNKKEFKAALEAYKEFYDGFYEEHFELFYDGDLAASDCSGRIVLDGNNKPVMAIADMTNMDEDYFYVDLYIYEYKNDEVTQLQMIPDMEIFHNGISMVTAEGNIYIKILNKTTTDIYKIHNGQLETMENPYWEAPGEPKLDDDGQWVEMDEEWDCANEISGSFEEDLQSIVLGSDSGEQNIKYCISDSDFDALLDYLTEHVSNPLEFAIAYSDFLREQGMVRANNQTWFEQDGLLYVCVNKDEINENGEYIRGNWFDYDEDNSYKIEEGDLIIYEDLSKYHDPSYLYIEYYGDYYIDYQERTDIPKKIYGHKVINREQFLLNEYDE